MEKEINRAVHRGTQRRVIALTLSALLLVSSLACAGSSALHSANGNQWQPNRNIPGVLRRDLVGDPSRPGPFKYQLKIAAGTRVAVHQHSKDVNVKVVSGSMFIIIGEPLESSRVQRFAAGSGFVVPAHTWHDEWWDEETVLEAEGVGPMDTVNRSNGAGENASAQLISSRSSRLCHGHRRTARSCGPAVINLYFAGERSEQTDLRSRNNVMSGHSSLSTNWPQMRYGHH